MLLFRPGLGATVSVNPNLVAQAATTKASNSGSVSTGDTSPFFSIQQHTWADVYHEQGRGLTAEQSEANRNLAISIARAIGATLPPCPAGSVTDKGTTCYYGYSPIANVRTDEGGVIPRGLLAPGTFDMWGVVFGVQEFAGGSVTRSYTPTPDQRRWVELALIDKSQRMFFGDRGAERLERYTVGSDSAVISRAIAGALGGKIFSSSTQIGNFADHASVDQMLAIVPDMALYLVNFERNPVQPTATERSQAGGWRSWLARGGYPLSNSVAHAQTPLSDREMVIFPGSIACQCPINGMPSALQGFLGTKGPGKPGDEAALVKTYISIPQTPGQPFTLGVVAYSDESWIRDVGEFGAKILMFIGKVFCDTTVQSVVQQHYTAAVSEHCVDAKGAACVKGSANCKCFSMPAYDQASVKASNLFTSWACNAWNSENAPTPPLPPPNPYYPPPPASASSIPWWLVGIGLVVGAVAANR